MKIIGVATMCENGSGYDLQTAAISAWKTLVGQARGTVSAPDRGILPSLQGIYVISLNIILQAL